MLQSDQHPDWQNQGRQGDAANPSFRANHTAIVIGAGPAGLMAAEVLSQQGIEVALYDAMPSPGRKFLLAGRGGLNLTHAEPAVQFNGRFRESSPHMAPLLEAFDANALRAWARGLGIDTFIGSSQRVFPVGMKAAPLLRAWLHRLRADGVSFQMRHRWLGWQGGALRFSTPDGEIHASAKVVILALGGASWSRLGSDGAWVPLLRNRDIDVATLKPANCGFDSSWSDHFRERFAGHPLKGIVVRLQDIHGNHHERAGELMITATGIEGSLVYALSAELRELIATNNQTTLHLDLNPGRVASWVTTEVHHPRGAKSLTSHLRARLGIHGVKAGLLREILGNEAFHTPPVLAEAIKSLPLKLTAAKPLEKAISSAGGVRFTALDEKLMVRHAPGLFCAGEMLDWEAPTGGYLLTGCFASGHRAGHGAAKWLAQAETPGLV